VTAVNEASHTVQKGEIFGLLDPEGAGKTTIHIRAILSKPTSGKVLANGINVSEKPQLVREEIGIVFSRPKP